MNAIPIAPIVLGLMISGASLSASSATKINYDRSSWKQSFQQHRVEQYAESIAVRIFPENSDNTIGGSGVLIHRAQDRYTVVTNHHVINKSDRAYRVQTPDGQVYPAQIIYVPQSDSEGDVGFLVFKSSDRNYPVVALKSNLKIEKETPVVAGGFPFNNNLQQSQTFHSTEGTISEVLERPFIGGYQIGYTNNVVQGMSGGPVLNYDRELVGINGLGQYPLLGNPYTFADGSTILDNQWEDFQQLSWAVPIEIIDRIKKKNGRW